MKLSGSSKLVADAIGDIMLQFPYLGVAKYNFISDHIRSTK